MIWCHTVAQWWDTSIDWVIWFPSSSLGVSDALFTCNVFPFTLMEIFFGRKGGRDGEKKRDYCLIAFDLDLTPSTSPSAVSLKLNVLPLWSSDNQMRCEEKYCVSAVINIPYSVSVCLDLVINVSIDTEDAKWLCCSPWVLDLCQRVHAFLVWRNPLCVCLVGQPCEIAIIDHR